MSRNASRADLLLQPGRNCWRRERSQRVAFLVDGAAYFAALAGALDRARHQVLLLGWDVHSRVRLRRGGEEGEAGSSTSFAELLDARVRQTPGLRIHLLAWDFAMIYALEREALPKIRFGRTHRRVNFALDGNHPLGASHHQKLVVVDDAVAFVGGLDVTACRWDTPEHREDEPRREDPGFGRYEPFHDVQMAVEGEAAAALGELARERWRLATGRKLRPPRGAADAWPGDLEPDLREVHVGIARTEPAFEGRPEVREVERLYADAIRGARRCIYLENQYLTSRRIGDLLQERLREPEGPEVVIVGPRSCSGWLEEQTMGLLRANLIGELRQADSHGRLAVYHPVLAGGRELLVHSKVALVDDRLLRVGSANLSNRSMGLDTELDLALEHEGREELSEAIRGFRSRLLAEHLGVDAASVEDAIRDAGSLRGGIERLRGGPRSLEPLDPSGDAWLGEVIPENLFVDPERPVDLPTFRSLLAPPEDEVGGGSGLRALLGIAAVVLLLLAWRLAPIGEQTPEELTAAGDWLRATAWAPLAAWVAFTVAGSLLFPVTLLIAASAVAFGWLVGAAVALAGALSTAAVGYAVGSSLWKDALRRLAGPRLNRLSRRLARGGVLAVAALRVVPVAPFAVVNMVAGASHIRFRDYAWGTLLGMGPGVLVLCLVTDRASRALLEPDPWNLVLVGAAVALAVAVLVWLRRRLPRDETLGEGPGSDS